MNDFENSLCKCRFELFNIPTVNEYLTLKKAILQDKYLIDINKKMRIHQKKMVESIQDEKLYSLKKKEYEQFREMFYASPLVINYQNVKRDIEQLLMEMKRIIE